MRAVNQTGFENPFLKQEIDWLGYLLTVYDRHTAASPATERAIKAALSGLTVAELADLVKAEWAPADGPLRSL